MARVFVDTNIWVYPYDRGSAAKRSRAAELLGQSGNDVVLSTQVMLEFYVVVTRKLTPAVPASTAARALERLAALPTVTTDPPLVLRAVDLSRAHHLSIWDAMIVEAAYEAGCDQIWTEDMPTGSRLRGIEIVNPLAAP